MAASCAITMAIAMTFRIPGAALGAYFPFLMPRDSFPSTWRAVKVTVVLCALGTIQLLAGAALFAGSPMAHFFWTIASICLVFYCISILTVGSAAIGFGLLTAGGIAIWDGMAPASDRVTLTLYLFLSILIGCGVTALVEYAVSRLRHADVVIDGIRVRISLVHQLLQGYVDGEQPSSLLKQHLRLYAQQGTGHLRDVLASSSHDDRYREQCAEVLALAHELATIASAAANLPQRPTMEDTLQLHVLIARLNAIEKSLLHSQTPARFEFQNTLRTSPTFPALTDLELTIDLLSDALTQGGESVMESDSPPSGALFRDGEHLKFVVRGGLSAMLCYLFYMSAGWRGLSASVVTCFLTAVTSVGMTRQRQLLRLLGVAAGGCILGIGSQALLLPLFETLPEFAIVFSGCIFVCAWVATSSSRVSFAGMQMGLAYVLVTLNGFGINTSLLPVRDALLGILLGLGAMWLVYDHLWSVPSAKAHQRTIVAVLHRLANLALNPQSVELHRERDWFARAFEELRAFTDARVFEPHPANQDDEQQIERIEPWQPLIGSLSLTFISLLEHIAGNGAKAAVTESVLACTREVLTSVAATFDGAVSSEPPSTARLLLEIEASQEDWTTPEVVTELRLDHALAVLLREIEERAFEHHEVLQPKHC
jgi:multidrug resistance protein MdtO